MLEKDRVIKGTSRIINASVLHVKLATGELTIWREKHEPGRIIDMLTTFFVAANAHIKDTDGKKVELSRIKPGSRVTVDYIKESTGRLVASNIIVTSKQKRGGEWGWQLISFLKVKPVGGFQRLMRQNCSRKLEKWLTTYGSRKENLLVKIGRIGFRQKNKFAQNTSKGGE